MKGKDGGIRSPAIRQKTRRTGRKVLGDNRQRERQIKGRHAIILPFPCVREVIEMRANDSG